MIDIKAECKSFLDVDPMEEPYCRVEYILLDPSCSGSGIVSRMDILVDSAASFKENSKCQDKKMESDERLCSLADFQLKAIEHAMKCNSTVPCY